MTSIKLLFSWSCLSSQPPHIFKLFRNWGGRGGESENISKLHPPAKEEAVLIIIFPRYYDF